MTDIKINLYSDVSFHVQQNLQQEYFCLCLCIYLPPGGPGSGRAEQCEMIVDRYPGSVHVSMGELLREQTSKLASSDMKWSTIKRLMDEGNMVPEVGSGCVGIYSCSHY